MSDFFLFVVDYKVMELLLMHVMFMLSILIEGCATEKLNPTQEEQKSIQKVGLVVYR